MFSVFILFIAPWSGDCTWLATPQPTSCVKPGNSHERRAPALAATNLQPGQDTNVRSSQALRVEFSLWQGQQLAWQSPRTQEEGNGH